MQQLENFYGFKVSIIDSIEPHRVQVLQERAYKILEMQNYNPYEYFVYFHQLLVEPKTHFNNKLNLSQKLKTLEIKFSVNPKQRQTGSIKLFNYLLDQEFEHISDNYDIRYFVDGKYLYENKFFKNELITFIQRKVPSKHRKIKLNLIPTPSEEWIKSLKHNSNSIITQLDQRYSDAKKITLMKPKKQIYSI